MAARKLPDQTEPPAQAATVGVNAAAPALDTRKRERSTVKPSYKEDDDDSFVEVEDDDDDSFRPPAKAKHNKPVPAVKKVPGAATPGPAAATAKPGAAAVTPGAAAAVTPGAAAAVTPGAAAAVTPGAAAAAPGAPPPAKRVKRDAAELDAEKFAKRLSGMPPKQLVEAVASFFSKGAGAGLRPDFLASLPAADTAALADDLEKARKAITRCFPRYSNTNQFAFNRCSGAIHAFTKLLKTHTKALVDAGVAADMISYAQRAKEVLRELPRFWDASGWAQSYDERVEAVLAKALLNAARKRTTGAADKKTLAKLADGLGPAKGKGGAKAAGGGAEKGEEEEEDDDEGAEEEAGSDDFF